VSEQPGRPGLASEPATTSQGSGETAARVPEQPEPADPLAARPDRSATGPPSEPKEPSTSAREPSGSGWPPPGAGLGGADRPGPGGSVVGQSGPERPGHAGAEGSDRRAPAGEAGVAGNSDAGQFGPQRPGHAGAQGSDRREAGTPGISDLGQFGWYDSKPSRGRGWPRRSRAPRRRWSRTRKITAAAIGIGLACTLLGGIVGGVVALRTMGTQTDSSYTVGSVPAATPAGRPATSVAAVAARDTPSVVMIKVNGGEGTGSGFIIRGGYIVTDNHVVTLDGMVGNASLRVYFTNGSSVPGVVVGRDPYSDIAVVKPEGMTRLPALTLGNSAGVDVGDPVIAIGSPLGLADTVTSGIVSALERPVQPAAASGTNPQVFFNAIQTDAPINPGNSGGPLVNAAGQVIGIDAAIDTLGSDPITGSQGGSIGLGFAIPIDQARRVIIQLIRTGHATHSVLGAALNENYTGNGAELVAQDGKAAGIQPDGPAAQAGLRAGDIIVTFAGLPISTAYGLMDAVRSQAPGAKVTVGFERQGQRHTTEITLGSAGS
jgi:putative serine protease PepD